MNLPRNQAPTLPELSDEQFERYARHLILEEVGETGQAKLLASSVLVLGAGGLGSPMLLYLAAAGVGRLGIVDDDRVELSNLQRQVLHATADLGRPKTESAADALGRINPGIRVDRIARRLDAGNVEAIIRPYDLVADGSDNFATRFVIADACYRLGKTLVSAAVLRFDGQLTTFKPHLGPPHPCLRCLHPDPPDDDAMPRCEQAGLLGALAGTLGAMQATEVLKELMGIGDSLSGSLLLYDALGTVFRKVRIKRSADCPLCGAEPGR
jgi:molybdopterin-synthase adenylyltransferase